MGMYIKVNLQDMAYGALGSLGTRELMELLYVLESCYVPICFLFLHVLVEPLLFMYENSLENRSTSVLAGELLCSRNGGSIFFR